MRKACVATAEVFRRSIWRRRNPTSAGTAARFRFRWESCLFRNLLFETQAVSEGVDRVHHLCAIGRDVEAGTVIFIILAKKLGVELLNARRSDHSRAARRRVAVMFAQMQRKAIARKLHVKRGAFEDVAF